MDDPNADEDTVDPDERRPMRLLDSLVQRDDEISDSEDEGTGGRRNHARRRDPDSVTVTTSPGARRYGVGTGIMGAAPPGAGSAVVAAVGGAGTVTGNGSVAGQTVAEAIGLAVGERSRSQSESVDMDVEDTPTPPGDEARELGKILSINGNGLLKSAPPPPLAGLNVGRAPSRS